MEYITMNENLSSILLTYMLCYTHESFSPRQPQANTTVRPKSMKKKHIHSVFGFWIAASCISWESVGWDEDFSTQHQTHTATAAAAVVNEKMRNSKSVSVFANSRVFEWKNWKTRWEFSHERAESV